MKGGNRKYFSYFFTETYIVGTHKKRLSEALLMSTTTYVCGEIRNKEKMSGEVLLMSTHNICVCGEISNNIML